MGKYLIGPEDVKRIDFGDGDWVEVRTELSQGDMEKLYAFRDNDTVALDKALPLLVVRWSFIEGDTPLPLTPENIANLRLKYRMPIYQAVSEAFKTVVGTLKNV